MTEQVKKEIIKAYAYGKTPQEAAAAMGRLRKGKASLKAAGG